MFDYEDSLFKTMSTYQQLYFLNQSAEKPHIVARSRLYFSNHHNGFRNLQNRDYNIRDPCYVVCAWWPYVCIFHGPMVIILKATRGLGPVGWKLVNYSIRTEEDY